MKKMNLEWYPVSGMFATEEEVGYGFIVRDLAGLPLVEVETVAEAQKWIDIEKDGYGDFRELD